MKMVCRASFLSAVLLLVASRRALGWSPTPQTSGSQQQPTLDDALSRRESLHRFLSSVGGVLTASTIQSSFVSPALAAGADLTFETAPSGLQWADARVGTGSPLKPGSPATVDYVLSTTGARYGSRIFATSDKDLPYRWTLGDGSTISGLEQAIVGGDGVAPMLPGGIRRVIIPQSLGYTELAAKSKELCVQDGRPGPIPPPNQAFEEYQRFKNIYCNSDRQYQPDIVMDIKLYGARSR